MKHLKLTTIAFTCLLLNGCASLGTIRVLEKSEESQPPWINSAPPSGYFKGLAHVQDERDGIKTALEDIKQQISNSLGISITTDSEKILLTYAYTNKINKKLIHSFKEESGAFLEDIESSIKNIYWQKIREKIKHGKKIYYRYFVLVYYPDSKLSEMKQKTEIENTKRLSQLKKSLRIADEQRTSRDFRAFHSYIYCYLLANTLFRQRNLHTIKTKHLITDFINSMNLIKESNYNELNPKRHSVSARVELFHKPLKNVPVNFSIYKGKGHISNIIAANTTGIAKIKVDMVSIQKENQIRAYLDFSNILAVDPELSDINYNKQVFFNFSTLAKKSRIKPGTAYIENKGFIGRKKYLSFNMTELNGLGARFNRYKIVFNANYKKIHLFSREIDTWNDSRIGEFSLKNTVTLNGGGVCTSKIILNPWATKAIYDLKREWHFKDMKIVLTLYGKDDNNNDCSVTLYSNALTKNLL